MPDFFDHFPTLLLIIMPGAVLLKAREIARPGERKSAGEQLLDVFLFSLINLAVNMPLFYLARISDLGFSSPLLFSLFALWVFVLCPALLGLAFSKVRGARPVEIPPSLPANSISSNPGNDGWEIWKSKGARCRVVFHFKSGRVAGGFFGPNSRATTLSGEPAIYLDEAWQVDENGRFSEKRADSTGLLIRWGTCDFVEFSDAQPAQISPQTPQEPSF